MATVVMNTPDEIVFCNPVLGKNAAAPTLKILAGDWDNDGALEAGVVFEVTGSSFPLLTAVDARKLSKWLARAADLIEDVKPQKKKSPQRYEQDEENDNYGFRFKE